MYVGAPIRRGLFFPPGATPRINEAHPAAGLLQAAYLFGPQPLAVLPGFGGLSVKTGTPVPAIGRTGVYTAYTATSGHVAASSPTGDISIVAVAMRSITPGSAGFVSNVQVAASSISVFATRNGIEFDIGNSYNTNPLRMIACHYDAGGSKITADGMWVNGGKETISSGAGSTDLANGVWYGVGATMSGVIAGNGALTIGDFVDNTFALTGGVQFLVLFRGILPDGLMSELTDNPAGLLLWPEDEFYGLAAGPLGTTVSLSGISLTASAGSVEEGISVAATGSAATSAAGTPTSAIASALAGSAGTASAGTATSGIGMSLTGEVLTVSAGSLAYTIGFTLTGSAATSAGGTLTSSGGDVLTSRSLTGISMTALPGNVRVTGGTRWRPSEAQAVTPPSMVGNTLQPPPRLVGDPASDNRAIQQWLQTLYDHVIKRDNVLGRIADHETRIAAIEATDDTGST